MNLVAADVSPRTLYPMKVSAGSRPPPQYCYGGRVGGYGFGAQKMELRICAVRVISIENL